MSKQNLTRKVLSIFIFSIVFLIGLNQLVLSQNEQSNNVLGRSELLEIYEELGTKKNDIELTIRLPSQLPLSEESTATSDDLFLHLRDVYPLRYSLTIDGSEDCQGARPCSFYSVEANSVNEYRSRSLTELASDFDQVSPKAISLKDKNGETVEAILVPDYCLAYCNPPRIFFDYESIRYNLSSMRLKPEDVIIMAESLLNDPIRGEDL